MIRNNQLWQAEILILESIHTSGDSLSIALPDLPYRFKKVGSSDELLHALELRNYAVVLLNAENDSRHLLDIIRMIKRKSAETVILVIANPLNRPIAAEAVNAGATDCLFTPVADSILLSKIVSACDMVKTRHELFMLRQQVAMHFAFDNLIGISAEIQKIKRTIQFISNNETAIILSGENGTGKNLLAKIIHYHSVQRKNPLTILDCSVLTAAQIASALWGAPLSDSEAPLPGSLFQRAASGTVFIDKLHALDSLALAQMQKNLLRQTAGGSFEFRLIMSVNEPLYDLYSKGIIDRKFIEKLNAIEISLPPLRARTEDIELLAAYFLRLMAYENGSETLSITPDAMEFLKSLPWAGNVRELEDCLRRAAAVCENNRIDISEVSFAATGSRISHFENVTKAGTAKAGSLSENQRQLIAAALAANEWNFTQTAKQLGIGRTTLWRKVRKFNLKKESNNRLDVVGVTTDGEQK